MRMKNRHRFAGGSWPITPVRTVTIGLAVITNSRSKLALLFEQKPICGLVDGQSFPNRRRGFSGGPVYVLCRNHFLRLAGAVHFVILTTSGFWSSEGFIGFVECKSPLENTDTKLKMYCPNPLGMVHRNTFKWSFKLEIT
jgi:hypothetical protein